MLATSTYRPLITPVYYHSSRLILRGAAYRTISTSFIRRIPDELKTTTPQGNAAKGTEGGHQRELSIHLPVHAYIFCYQTIHRVASPWLLRR